MPSADDPTISNSFDIFCRGEEILSGGQRLHSAAALKKRLKEAHIAESSMTEYLESFEMGMPPHAGGGIGLERLVMLFLKVRGHPCPSRSVLVRLSSTLCGR